MYTYIYFFLNVRRTARCIAIEKWQCKMEIFSNRNFKLNILILPTARVLNAARTKMSDFRVHHVCKDQRHFKRTSGLKIDERIQFWRINVTIHQYWIIYCILWRRSSVHNRCFKWKPYLHVLFTRALCILYTVYVCAITRFVIL